MVTDLAKRYPLPATIAVKIVPKSSRNEIVGLLADGSLKIKIAAVPEKGKANEELCAFLAAEFHVPKSAVSVVSGHTAPMKRVRIEAGTKNP